MDIETPMVEIHHVRAGQGMAQRSNHIGGAIGLCAGHHRTGGHGIALHAGQQAFEKEYGTELTLLNIVNQELGYGDTNTES
jgi:hypothetical protein